MTIIVLGNVAFRTNGPLEKGRVIDSHAHNFDHVTMISHGAMLIEVLDAAENVVSAVTKTSKMARNFVLILKGTRHRLTALEDGTVYQCVYAHRDEEGNVVEDYTGWEKAYT